MKEIIRPAFSPSRRNEWNRPVRQNVQRLAA